MYTFHPLELQSYCTKVHQIFTRCSQIISDKSFEIGTAKFHSTKATNENEPDNFAHFNPKIGCHSKVA